MNIFIIGPGRTGKTTLASQIKNLAPRFNVIHTDAIRNILQQGFAPNFGQTTASEFLDYEHNDYFANFFINFLRESSHQEFDTSSYILEGSQITPSDIHHYLTEHELRNSKIICLGHGKLTTAEIFDLIRKNDTKSDWSYKLSDEELMKKAAWFYQRNQLYREECLACQIEYIDTTKNRAEILRELAQNCLHS